MFLFWFGLFAILVAVVAGISMLFGGRTLPRVGVIALALVVFGLSWIGASYAKVPNSNVGILTSFNVATGKTTGSGVHFTAPWQNIADWDATRQPFDYLNAPCQNPGEKGSLWVSIDGQREACIRLQVNWRSATTDAASRNWASYKGDPDKRFQQFVDRQVDPAIKDAVQAIFRPLNPLALIDPKTGDATVPDLDGTYTSELKQAVLKPERLGNDIIIDSISWGVIGYDKPTRDSISAFAQKNYETRNLTVDTANAATRANIATKSGVPAGEQACLDMIKALGKGEPGLCVASVTSTRPVG